MKQLIVYQSTRNVIFIIRRVFVFYFGIFEVKNGSMHRQTININLSSLYGCLGSFHILCCGQTRCSLSTRPTTMTDSLLLRDSSSHLTLHFVNSMQDNKQSLQSNFLPHQHFIFSQEVQSVTVKEKWAKCTKRVRGSKTKERKLNVQLFWGSPLIPASSAVSIDRCL